MFGNPSSATDLELNLNNERIPQTSQNVEDQNEPEDKTLIEAIKTFGSRNITWFGNDGKLVVSSSSPAATNSVLTEQVCCNSR